MFLYPLCLVALLFLSCLLQQFLPPLSGWYDARLMIFPLVVLCLSYKVSTAGMLAIAFLGGFLWDAQQVFLVQAGDPLVYHSQPDNLKFGFTIILYAVMGWALQGTRSFFKEGNDTASSLLLGLGLFCYLLIEYLVRIFMIGGSGLETDTIRQIGATSLLSTAFAPFVLWGTSRLAGLCQPKRPYRH